MVKIVNELSEISKNKKVIIDFFAEWCGPCKKISPMYNELSETYSDIEFYKCNVDESASLSEEFGINALPTFVSLNNGKVVKTMEGASLSGLKELLDELKNMKEPTQSNSSIGDECCGANKDECCNNNKDKCSKSSCSCNN
jgi:thioredoxin 1